MSALLKNPKMCGPTIPAPHRVRSIACLLCGLTLCTAVPAQHLPADTGVSALSSPADLEAVASFGVNAVNAGVSGVKRWFKTKAGYGGLPQDVMQALIPFQREMFHREMSGMEDPKLVAKLQRFQKSTQTALVASPRKSYGVRALTVKARWLRQVRCPPPPAPPTPFLRPTPPRPPSLCARTR